MRFVKSISNKWKWTLSKSPLLSNRKLKCHLVFISLYLYIRYLAPKRHCPIGCRGELKDIVITEFINSQSSHQLSIWVLRINKSTLICQISSLQFGLTNYIKARELESSATSSEVRYCNIFCHWVVLKNIFVMIILEILLTYYTEWMQ